MPPRALSRYSFSAAVTDDAGVTHLYGEEPFRYVDVPDNRRHVVSQGDSLFSLAAKYWPEIERAEGLYWVIADFQPEPIHDVTLELEVGTVVVIPSYRTLIESVFNDRRRVIP